MKEVQLITRDRHASLKYIDFTRKKAPESLLGYLYLCYESVRVRRPGIGRYPHP